MDLQSAPRVEPTQAAEEARLRVASLVGATLREVGNLRVMSMPGVPLNLRVRALEDYSMAVRTLDSALEVWYGVLTGVGEADSDSGGA